MAKQKNVKEERLEDILFECRDNLRGKAAELLKRQAANTTCLAAAFKALGVQV